MKQFITCMCFCGLCFFSNLYAEVIAESISPNGTRYFLKKEPDSTPYDLRVTLFRSASGAEPIALTKALLITSPSSRNQIYDFKAGDSTVWFLVRSIAADGADFYSFSYDPAVPNQSIERRFLPDCPAYFHSPTAKILDVDKDGQPTIEMGVRGKPVEGQYRYTFRLSKDSVWIETSDGIERVYNIPHSNNEILNWFWETTKLRNEMRLKKDPNAVPYKMPKYKNMVEYLCANPDSLPLHRSELTKEEEEKIEAILARGGAGEPKNPATETSQYLDSPPPAVFLPAGRKQQGSPQAESSAPFSKKWLFVACIAVLVIGIGLFAWLARRKR